MSTGKKQNVFKGSKLNPLFPNISLATIHKHRITNLLVTNKNQENIVFILLIRMKWKYSTRKKTANDKDEELF
jgi:hypothetical protein